MSAREQPALTEKERGGTWVNGKNGSRSSAQDDDLARLRFAAGTAEEAARWLRNCLARMRTGHEVEFELRTAAQAVQAALERITGKTGDPPSETGKHVKSSPTY
jgi:ATP/maltotriose-dependent transcriptional regulator MalT